jgi:hypothetical protein
MKEPAMIDRFRHWMGRALVALAVGVFAPCAEAQRDYEPLFDRFNLKLEGSWVGLNTEVRLDSELAGTGTTLSFEDDLNLDGSKTIPTLAFEWQVARRHRLGVRWQDISRDSTAQALTEIRWGDEVIPIDARIQLGFDLTQTFVDWTYYPWVREKWAAGFGLGFRLLQVSAGLTWEQQQIGDGRDSADGTGPLPYLYGEYRRLLGDHWRVHAGLGWLYVEIEDIKGGQVIARLGGEYLLGERWGFGAAFNYSTIDVDWGGLQTDEGDSVLTAAIKMDISDFSVFVRLRF